MLKITFRAEQDYPEIQTAVEHYSKLWDEIGSTVLRAAKQVSGLGFQSKQLEAIVYDGVSQSHPLKLQATTNHQRSRGDLVHELMHILLTDNNIHSDVIDDPNHTRRAHKLLDLILFDVYVGVFGREFAREQVALERSQSPDYEQAWDWVLAMGPAERKTKFATYRQANNGQ